MSFYLSSPNDANMGFSESHCWMKSPDNFSIWWINGLDPFTTSGYAVVNDFGVLVEAKP